jgi:transcriptional regulator with XRE-family HTH domain
MDLRNPGRGGQKTMARKKTPHAALESTVANLPLEETARSVGERLKQIRKSQKVTLIELAEKTGVDIATISRIENGKMTGTIESHVKLATALGVKLVDLYQGIEEARTRDAAHFQSAGKRREVYVHQVGKTSIALLTNDVLKKKLMPVLLSVEPGGSTQTEENKVGTEKFIYLLEGQLSITVADEEYALKKGSTLYFDASLPHRFTNTDKPAARALVVTTPPVL